MRCLEFHTDPRTGDAMYGHSNEGSLHPLTEKDKDIIEFLLDESENFYPGQYAALNEVYGRSSLNRPYFDFLRARRIVNCCFGENDSQPDIDEFGNLHFERVKCPLIAECKYHKVICQPKFRTTLTVRELEVMRMFLNGMKAECIASKLILSIHTVNNHRKNALRRLKLHSLAEFSNYAHINGLYNNTPL